MRLENVDLEIAQSDHGRERHRVAVRATHHGHDACQQLFWGKRDGQDVIDAPLEGGQLCLQIAASREGNGWHALRVSRTGRDMLHDLLAAEVGVEDDQVRPPLVDGGDGLVSSGHLTHAVDAVVEGQVHERGQRDIVEQEHDAGWAAGWPARRFLLASRVSSN